MLRLNIEPMNQIWPYFRKYINLYRKDLEPEAYAVQTQSNSFKIAVSPTKKYC